jgi:hypothetical protein
MGQEIVYCFKCQKRISSSDYAKGTAFQLENRSCCSACAVQVLDTLDARSKELLLGKMFKATQDRQSATSPSNRTPVGPHPGSSSRKIPVPPTAPPPSSMPLVLGIGAAVVVVVLLLAVVLSGSSPPPAPPAPPVARPPAPAQGPSPEEKRRSEVAKDALRKAREFAISHPKDFEGQVQQWKVALLDAERTGYELEVKREIERTRQKAMEAAAQELADLEKEIARLNGRKEFKAALELLARERPRRGAADIDRLERDVQDASGRAFEEVRAKAVAARDRGVQSEVDAARSEVARWGIPAMVANLDAALALPWRPIFDGKSLKGFGPIANAWRVEDGMLIHDNNVDNAAVATTSLGEGEYRVRFDIQKASLLTFRFRLQGHGHDKVEFSRADLDSLSPGDHELLYSFRNGTATAAFDGKPWKITTEGKPTVGMIQFNTVQGAIRIKALEHRPLK